MEGELAQWRDEDMKQQHLDNALALWTRFEKGLRTEMVGLSDDMRFKPAKILGYEIGWQ